MFEQIRWKNLISLTYLHVAGFYGLKFIPSISSLSGIIIFLLFLIATGSAIEIAGHRCFTHNAFKPNSILKYIFVMFQSMNGLGPILHWARDHRTHHKFADTEGDPFFYDEEKRFLSFMFSHNGHLIFKKSAKVIEKGKTIDMSDLENDSLLVFQKKFYRLFMILFTLILPTLFCYYIFEKSLYISWHLNLVRLLIVLHGYGMANSAVHKWGEKPYDKYNTSTESYFLGYILLGGGWHNFHHTFPLDYRSTDRDTSIWFNFSKYVIDFFAFIGWATDLKITPDHIIKQRVLRTGDGSHKYSKEAQENQIKMLNINNNYNEKLNKE